MTIVPEPMNVIYGLHLVGEPERIRYVGQTTKGAMARLDSHRRGKNMKLPVSKWIRRHGADAIATSVLAVADGFAELDALEIEWIDLLETHVSRGGMNVTMGGGGMRGYIYSDAHRAATSARMSGKNHPLWGVSPSTATRNKNSISHKGLQAGEEAKHRVLSANQVMEIFIRRDDGETATTLGNEFGVSAGQITMIHLGKCWQSVTGVEYDPDRSHRRRATARLKLDLESQYARAIAPVKPRPPISDTTRAKLSLAKRGDNSRTSKIAEIQAIEIKRRLALGEMGTRLAEEFGVHKATISDIKTGKTWAWIK